MARAADGARLPAGEMDAQAAGYGVRARRSPTFHAGPRDIRARPSAGALGEDSDASLPASPPARREGRGRPIAALPGAAALGSQDAPAGYAGRSGARSLCIEADARTVWRRRASRKTCRRRGRLRYRPHTASLVPFELRERRVPRQQGPSRERPMTGLHLNPRRPAVHVTMRERSVQGALPEPAAARPGSSPPARDRQRPRLGSCNARVSKRGNEAGKHSPLAGLNGCWRAGKDLAYGPRRDLR